MDDFFAGLEAFDDEESTTATNARAERIAAARRAATTYQAKIEEPQWFMAEDLPVGPKGTTRPDAFAVHQLYLDGRFDEALEKVLALLARDRKGGQEDVELYDLAMRSALKSGVPITPEVLDLARGYKTRRTHPSLAYTASRVFVAAPPALVDPQEALEAILSALSRHSTLLPYLNWLSKLLAPSYPLLNEVLVERTLKGREKAVQEGVESLQLDELERVTLEKVLGLGGEVQEEEEEAVRDVRSL